METGLGVQILITLSEESCLTPEQRDHPGPPLLFLWLQCWCARSILEDRHGHTLLVPAPEAFYLTWVPPVFAFQDAYLPTAAGLTATPGLARCSCPPEMAALPTALVLGQ